jgi:hypothetical protein
MTNESWFDFRQGLVYLSSQKSPYWPWGPHNPDYPRLFPPPPMCLHGMRRDNFNLVLDVNELVYVNSTYFTSNLLQHLVLCNDTARCSC